MKVAVIGAGFSGMLSAYLLEKENIEVSVFEKEEVIGGHCRTLKNKDVCIELGSVFSLRDQIKELLLELKVDYTEKFTYRTFIDEHYHNVEHIPRKDIKRLMQELHQLQDVLKPYQKELEATNYQSIPGELMVSLEDFLARHELTTIAHVIAPHLSSFGYGNINTVQAYYVFKIFNLTTINSFIQGEKFLFIDNGTSELITKLSQNITDIRYSVEVTNISVNDNKVIVRTPFSEEIFDKVLITSKLPHDVIDDDLYKQLMKKIDTHPFITCAYDVKNRNLVTTYFKANLGEVNRLQFFHPTRSIDRSIIVAYAYGHVEKALINNITEDIRKSGVEINHLITAKQWYIFPHLNKENLTEDYYQKIYNHQQTSNIKLIGSLVCEPALSKLYVSVKQTVQDILCE